MKYKRFGEYVSGEEVEKLRELDKQYAEEMVDVIEALEEEKISRKEANLQATETAILYSHKSPLSNDIMHSPGIDYNSDHFWHLKKISGDKIDRPLKQEVSSEELITDLKKRVLKKGNFVLPDPELFDGIDFTVTPDTSPEKYGFFDLQNYDNSSSQDL